MTRTRLARLIGVSAAVLTVVPATSAFAADVESDEPAETDTFCTGYPSVYAAMEKLNARLMSRYDAAMAGIKFQGNVAAPRTDLTRGRSAERQSDKAGGQSATARGRKAQAILSVQNRLADRSSALAGRVADECGATIAPLAKIVVDAPPEVLPE